MKGHRYFLDTNIFLRVIVKDNKEKLAACEALFEMIEQGKIKAFTSHLVLAEIVWTAQKSLGIPKKDIIKILEGILHIKNLKIEDGFDLSLAIHYFQTSPVKFVDALIASHTFIQKKETVVVSYDKDFDTIGIIRKEPSELVMA